MQENCNTLIQLVTSASSHRTNVSITPKVTINDKSWNGELTCKTEPLLQFTHLTARWQQRPFEKDVTYAGVKFLCVLPLCVGRLSLWQIWLSSWRPPTVNSHACSSLPLTLWSHLTTPASLPGKKPQLAPLPACFSSVHRFRFSGRPEGSSAPSSDGQPGSWT